MSSPFPGMDPYLEPHWLDVHHRLVTYTSDWLNENLPVDLVATTEERVAIDAGGEALHRVGPDVKVFAPSTSDPAETGEDVIVAPFKLVVDLDPVVEPYVRILDAAGTLITVIEYVSPTNKRGDGLVDYRKKRDELLSGGVNVVEIDLVRAGNWRSLLSPARVPPEAMSAYRAIVRRAGHPLGGYVFPITFERPAPDVSIPLRAEDKPLPLPLQSLIEQVYKRGRYAQRLQYDLDLDPPLSGPELETVRSLIPR